MASPQHTSFTAFPLPPNATTQWFWRRYRRATKPQSRALILFWILGRVSVSGSDVGASAGRLPPSLSSALDFGFWILNTLPIGGFRNSKVASLSLKGISSTARRVQRCLVLVLLGVLTLLLTLAPVASLAQSSTPTPPAKSTTEADVVVDGQVLFKVKNIGNSTAEERSQIINKALEEEVRSKGAVDVEIVPDKEKLILRSRTSNRELITLEKADAPSENQLLQKAREWERSIEAALQQSKLERTPTYYRQALLFSIGVLLGAIALHIALHFFGKFLSRQIKQWLGDYTLTLNPQARSAKLVLQLAFVGLQVGLWLAVNFYITDTLPDARIWRYKLFKFLTSPVLTLGEVNYSALQVLQLIALTVALWFGVSFLTRLFKSYVLVRTGADAGVQDVIAVLTQYVLAFLGLIVLLQTSGLDLRSLAIFASVVGVGIGFGVQNIANNLISGLIITLERPIKVGDFVKVGEQMGTVKRIGARSTEIYTLDQVSIIVPNSRFLESEVVNWSYGNPVSRLLIPVGVAYGSNIQQVQAALLEAARSHPEVLVRPQPQVWFLGFGASSLDFDLRVWVGDPKKQFRIKSDLNYRIEAAFRRYNIEVPFPQHDINVRSPQLDELVTTLLHKNGSKSSVTTEIPALQNARVYSPDSDEQSIQPQEPTVLISEPTQITAPSKEKPPEVDVEALVTAMREPGGLEIKDRRVRMNLYLRCFLGSEAVEWLMQTQNCTREDAIDIGQLLVDRGIIHHVLDEQPFLDDNVFYRFYTDEQ